ncbi:MAG: hypothetical protein K2G45_11070 [Lachnospiraceae bacterium]|nr:hypothetical protein [Lachnospiraceae bacterium]
MKRKKVFAILSLTACIVMLVSTVCFARDCTIKKEYGIYTLTCYINCDKSSGTGSTSGSARPYDNYVSVSIYDIDQKLIGADSKSQESKVTLTLKKTNKVYGTQTTHAVMNGHGGLLAPTSQMIFQYQGR